MGPSTSMRWAAFNENVHRFLGRSELGLVFNANAGGYEIIRNGVPKHDGNLSEGEKTALAFVYFITKLSEHDNEIGKTVVVVDDPVSSFDSNHLFHAYSFLRNRCDDAMQLLFLPTTSPTSSSSATGWLDGTETERETISLNWRSFTRLVQHRARPVLLPWRMRAYR